MGDRILVKIKEAEEKTMRGILLPSTGSKIKEAEEKTMGGILLPSTGQSKPQGGEVVDVGERGIIGKNKVDITVPVSKPHNPLQAAALSSFASVSC